MLQLQAIPLPAALPLHRPPRQQVVAVAPVRCLSFLQPPLAHLLLLRLALFLRLLTLPRALPPDHLVFLGHVSLVRDAQRNSRPLSPLLLRTFHHHLTVLLRHLFGMVTIGAPHAIVLVPLLQVSCAISLPRTLATPLTTLCARSLLPSTASLVPTHPVAVFGEQALALAIAVCRAQMRDHLALEISSQGQPVLFPAPPHRPHRKLRTPPPPSRARRRKPVASFLYCFQRTSQTAYASYRRPP